ncbi:MAG: energy transducer TonB [Candidatus Hydrogenedentota bacterium]|nr:MAG: energy transducer TonB [Candidatus Hydrogenedentota bacterium]
MIDRDANEDNRRWALFFLFSSWLIFSILFSQNILRETFLKPKTEPKNNSKQISVLVENPRDKEEKPDPFENALSNQNRKARWLKKEKRQFNVFSTYRELSFSKRGEKARKVRILAGRYSDKEAVKVHQKIKKTLEGNGGDTNFGKEKVTRIPDNYRFQYREALSWDRFGYPQIPAIRYKYYEFFKNMLDKIQSNWAPPGGIPSPIYDDDYHRIQPVPGYVRFQTFPPQEIKVAFMLDEKGNVLDVRLISSLGYKSLDASCIEAIRRSRNFGKVPKDLLKNNRVIIPIIFRILVR